MAHASPAVSHIHGCRIESTPNEKPDDTSDGFSSVVFDAKGKKLGTFKTIAAAVAKSKSSMPAEETPNIPAPKAGEP